MDATPKRVEKRNRPPVSCELCRTRKLKCNRELPCDTCVRRNKSSLCHYAANANRSKSGSSKQRDMKDRLHTLEALVSSFLSGDAVVQPGTQPDATATAESSEINTAAADPNQISPARASSLSSGSRGDTALTPETPHLQETRDGQLNYIDPSHWQSILEDIKEVREHLSESTLAMTDREFIDISDQADPDPGFVSDSTSTPSLPEILTSLPPQPICDMLLSAYFQARFLVQGLIHPVKFQKDYEAFWQAPTEANPLWVGILFAILSITATLRIISNPNEPHGLVPPARVLRERVVHCLVLGRYANSNAYALEAFVLHLHSSVVSSDFVPVNVWFEMGTVIRLAFRQGYHRDPSTLQGISIFDGEMRRRLWLNIFQVEALLSFQMGFPSMIPTEYCDSQVPRNLEYSDLYEDMTELPPSRPLTEQTPMLYSVSKAPVMRVFKKIVGHTQALAVPSYERTLELDEEMTQAYTSMPMIFQGRDINRSFMDPSALIIQRCSIELLRHKATIILHRRYISYELQSMKFEHSQRTCVEAALGILARQADLHQASLPGGRLFEDRWMIMSLPNHDYLLASMVVCMDLSVRMRFGAISSAELRDQQRLTGREYRALQTAHKIWTSQSGSSRESHIAALAVNLMINKVAANDEAEAVMMPIHGNNNQQALAVFDATAAATATAGMPSFMDLELPYAQPMSQMIDGSETIDWSLLDQYFQNLDGSNANANANADGSF